MLINPRLLALLPLSFLVACSGGGGSSSGSQTVPAESLLIDTAGDVREQLSGRLALVAFEEPTGEIGGNVLRGNPLVDLIHPEGVTEGVELEPFPPGAKAAVHLMFIDDSLVITLENGEEHKIEIPGHGIRVPFAEPTDLNAKRPDWLMIEHRGLDMQQRSDGVVEWRPDMRVSNGDEHMVENKLIRVLSANADSETAFGEFCDDSRMIVEMRFDEDAILTEEAGSEPLSLDEFFMALGDGAKIEVDGYLDGAFLLVLTAQIVEPGDDPNPKSVGNKSDMSGVIREILGDEGAFMFEVFRIKKSGRNVPNELPLTLKVFAGDTKIKWVPRMGRHTGHLPFSALEEDMFVDVEWLGPAYDNTVPDALKVDIRSDRAPAMLECISGTILEINLMDKVIVIQLDGPDMAEISYADDTVFLEREGDEFVKIEPMELMIGDEISALAEKLSDTEYEAALIRLRMPDPIPGPVTPGG